jgi:uncharacterized Zn finger protein (UPF0148 family)
VYPGGDSMNNQCPRCGAFSLVHDYGEISCLLCGYIWGDNGHFNIELDLSSLFKMKKTEEVVNDGKEH